MIPKDIADSTISIISNENIALSKLSEQFQKSCNKIDQFSILTSLAALLMDAILDQLQQIITVWLLYSTFDDLPIRENPFFDVFQFVIHSGPSSSNSYSQKLFDIINCFMNLGDLNDIAEKSATEILDPNFSIDSSNNSDLLTTTVQQVPRISSVIISKADPSATQISQHNLLRELLIDPSLWTEFEVPFCRVIPSISQPSGEELQFMYANSVDGTPYIFDELKGFNTNEVSRIFIQHSTKRKLKKFEISSILEEYKVDKTILQFKLSKEEENSLLELNPEIAAIYFKEYAKKDISILKKFAESDINQSTIEVIKEIVVNLKPNISFLQSFILHSSKILTETKDLNVVRNKAKLFCSLILYLHQNNVQFSNKIYIYLNSLQIELSGKGIKEVSVLSSIDV